MQGTLQKLQEKLEALKRNTELIEELEFEEKLMTLLKRYSKTVEDLKIFMHAPGAVNPGQPRGRLPSWAKQNRQKRKNDYHV